MIVGTEPPCQHYSCHGQGAIHKEGKKAGKEKASGWNRASVLQPEGLGQESPGQRPHRSTHLPTNLGNRGGMRRVGVAAVSPRGYLGRFALGWVSGARRLALSQRM